MQGVEYWLWLANALGPCASNSARVLRAFPAPEKVALALGQQKLNELFTPAQMRVLKSTRPQELLSRMERCRQLGVQIVTWADPDYPPLLRQIDSPPPVLYYRGDLSAASAPLVLGMIGPRRPSAYGVEAMQFLAQGLAGFGAVLVSGMAEGLDGEAHRACLRKEMPTIACLGFGHQHCYPAQNHMLKKMIEKCGLTLSEYPPDKEPCKAFFPQRNRLIAGLSRGVCVVEARENSATSNTVSHALRYNRDVFSVPGSIFSPLSAGTNRLLTEGAVPVTCAKDIFRFYGLESAEEEKPAPAEEPELSPDARKIRQLLSSRPQTLASLCEKAGLEPLRAMAAFTELEIKGVAQQLAGRQFILKGS